MYRIETHSHVSDPSTLGPCIEMEDPQHARAFAEGLRAEGLDVELLYRAHKDEPWRSIPEIGTKGAHLTGDRVFDEFVVIVRRGHPASAEDYELATPCIFLTRSLAGDYAATIKTERHPLVVRGQFSKLKF